MLSKSNSFLILNIFEFTYSLLKFFRHQFHGLLCTYDFLPGHRFNGFERVSGNRSALFGDSVDVFKTCRVLLLVYLRGGFFRQRVQQLLYAGHVLVQILLLHILVLLLLLNRFAASGLSNDVGESGKFLSLIHTTVFPFIRKLLSDFNTSESLIDPFLDISKFQIGFHGAIDRYFRVLRFFDALIADLSQPLFEWLCFG
jgi:hypothetical protein